MAEERKGYKYKEEHPIKNKFHSNAEDVIFYDAAPLTDEDRQLLAEMTDKLFISEIPGKKVPGPGQAEFDSKIHENKD